MNMNKRTTKPSKPIDIHDDEKLKSAIIKYIQDQAFNAYQKVLRSISHHYIDVLKDTTLVNILIRQVRLASVSTQITRSSTRRILCVVISLLYVGEYSYELFR